MTPGHKKMPLGRKTVTPGHKKVTPGTKRCPGVAGLIPSELKFSLACETAEKWPIKERFSKANCLLENFLSNSP